MSYRLQKNVQSRHRIFTIIDTVKEKQSKKRTGSYLTPLEVDKNGI